MTAPEFDVLIIGGGVAGLACAELLRQSVGDCRPAIRIGVLESQPPHTPAHDAPTGLRVFAIAPAAREILTTCGAWQHLPPSRAAAYERMRVWQADSAPFGAGSIGFDAADIGLQELGHIVEHDWLRAGLWHGLASRCDDAVALIAGKVPVALERSPDHIGVRLEDGAVLRTRLLIGADGVDSWVRGQLNLPSTGRAYGQLALVAHVSSERPHQRTAWQCFTRSGPIALLPLTDGRSSIVWSCFEPEARALLALADGEFSSRLTAATNGVLGALQTTTARGAFPLAVRHSHRYTGERFALIGDAAHQIHPLAGQGVNLGLLDAAALAETLATHLATRLADPGDAQVLRHYERWRKGANLLSMAAMDGLHRVFTSEWSGITRAATAGLGVVDRVPLLKRLLSGQAAGLAGRLPRAAVPNSDRLDAHAGL